MLFAEILFFQYIDDIYNLTNIKREECINYVRDNFNANININNHRSLIYFINKYEAEKVLEWIESLFLVYELNK